MHEFCWVESFSLSLTLVFQVSGEASVGRQDLNESTLDLNARDGDEELEETKDETW